MTDQEFERVLHRAAGKLPEPAAKMELPAGAEHTAHKNVRPFRRWVAVCAIIAVVVIGTGGALAYCSNVAWAGLIHNRLDQWVLNEYGVRLPEELGEYPFSYMSKSYVCPEGTPEIIAFLLPAYVPLDVSYSLGSVTEEGKPVDREESWFGENDLSVFIGKTDNDYWTTYFSYDSETREPLPREDEYTEYDMDVYTDIETEEYQGITLYQYDRTWTSLLSEETNTWHCITWVDDTLGVCFSLYTSEWSEYTPLEYAEMVIDYNHS